MRSPRFSVANARDARGGVEALPLELVEGDPLPRAAAVDDNDAVEVAALAVHGVVRQPGAHREPERNGYKDDGGGGW